MVMVGLVTPVTIWVGSVTSTCLWSSLGDMRSFSGPMLPLSSGTLPGQISTTSESSAPATGQAMHIHVTRQTVEANRIRDKNLLFDDALKRESRHPHPAHGWDDMARVADVNVSVGAGCAEIKALSKGHQA